MSDTAGSSAYVGPIEFNYWHPKSKSMTADQFMARRSTLIQYLKDRADQYDWHAVADAACDLRVLEAEWNATRALQPKWTDAPAKQFVPSQHVSGDYTQMVEEMNAKQAAKA